MQAVKPDWSQNKWVEPEKLIKEQKDLETFKNSTSYKEYVDFILRLQASIQGKAVSSTAKNAKLQPYVELLTRLKKLVDEVPPIQQPMRFGNTAFKDWHSKAMDVCSILI
jgi:serine/threonine-protein phosphatase 2A activator